MDRITARRATAEQIPAIQRRGDDARGLHAFKGKRPPNFQGR
ncbi:MAG: hypothetical protein WCI38_07175 [Chthoniobacterales bacterium]